MIALELGSVAVCGLLCLLVVTGAVALVAYLARRRER
jgi:hypothetical protein